MANIVALTEAATIGLHSIVLIARSREVLNVAGIAKQINSSRHHVAKVLQRLAKEGFIGSNRGPSGGFFLEKDPGQITLLDIYEAIEGKYEVHTCPSDKEMCPFGSCLLGDLSYRVSTEIKDFLASKTLKSYLS